MSENRDPQDVNEPSESRAAARESELPAGVSWAEPHREEPVARLGGPRRGRRLKRPEAASPRRLTAEQRLLILDSWKRSGLAAGDFSPLVGLSKHTLSEHGMVQDTGGGADLDRIVAAALQRCEAAFEPWLSHSE